MELLAWKATRMGTGMGQREGRRRRVLREDTGNTASSTQVRSRIVASTKAYADEALAELQPRVTDLIPQRFLGLLVLLVSGVLAVVSIDGLFLYGTDRLAPEDAQVTASFDLQGSGTIAGWLSSTLLLMASAAALLVFTTRRHKVDDYRGRYSLWLWMAILCVVASLDVSTGLHRLLQIGLVRLTGTIFWGDGSIWWIAVAGLVSLVVGGRALIDMWPCKEGVFFLSVAAACYFAATLNHFGVHWPVGEKQGLLVQSSALMLGHFLVLYSFLLYARSIYREAQGHIVRPRQRNVSRKMKLRRWFGRRRQQAASSETDGQAESPATGRPAAQQSSPPEADLTAERDSSDVDDSSDLDEAELDMLTDPDLSKTERRRLRKKLRRQQQQRHAA